MHPPPGRQQDTRTRSTEQDRPEQCELGPSAKGSRSRQTGATTDATARLVAALSSDHQPSGPKSERALSRGRSLG
eukprot:1916162-Alexandrium_andersonii.AAC.1